MDSADIHATGWLAALPAWVPGLAALVFLFLWIRLPYPRAFRPAWRIWLVGLMRVGLGWLALRAAVEPLRRFVVFAGPWPISLVLGMGALAVEAVRALYRRECAALPRSRRVLLLALRSGLVLLLAGLLTQPVRVQERQRTVRRRLVVLVDESASMHVQDNNMTPSEKVRWAEALAFPGVERPRRWEDVVAALRRLRETLAAHSDALASPLPSGRRERTQTFRRRTDAVQALVEAAQRTVGETGSTIAELGQRVSLQTPAVWTAVSGLTNRLAVEVRGLLEEARAAATAADPAASPSEDPFAAVRTALRRASEALEPFERSLSTLGQEFDAAFYAQLREEARLACDALAQRSRLGIARSLLADREDPRVPPERRAGLVRTSLEGRGVRLLTFAAEPVERSPKSWVAVQPAGPDAPSPRRTDLAAALNAVAALPAAQTAGVLLLTDGRHNGAQSVEAAARQLALRQVPVFVLPFGAGPLPPTDAAVVSVEAPDTVGTNDRVVVRIDVKVDGLAGTNVGVRLYDGSQLVASNTLTPPGPSFRQTVQLSHLPGTNGLHLYRVEVDRFEHEVLTNNNEATVPVWVTPDRTRLLLIDGYPRWEFRFLKNLFLRDTTLRLQYVLLHPDTVAGLTSRVDRAASVLAAETEAEATRLPETEAEWMKFDVIVLGDVDPAELGPGHLEALRRFVTHRGGTLIAIAGPRHLPRAYRPGLLAEVIPVQGAGRAGEAWTESPDPAFRIALTPEGQRCEFLQMADEEGEHRDIWSRFPPLYWRAPLDGVSEGARVLAWAVPSEEEAFVPDAWVWRLQEGAERDPREVQRRRALLVVHHHGRGKVLFLATDQTWRLRFRHGDRYHHRFWNQVIRWAAADRVAFGHDRLRVETDRPRYAPDQPVRVRARVVGPDFGPIPDATVVAVIRRGDRRVLRRRLAPVAEGASLYEATLGTLPEGVYRVEIGVETQRSELETGEPVAADFAVVRDLPSETAELTADVGLLGQVAAQTGGALLQPSELANLDKRLGPPAVTLRDRRQHDWWSSPGLLALLVLLAAGEWGLRKKEGLP